jgi:hypothetical protein
MACMDYDGVEVSATTTTTTTTSVMTGIIVICGDPRGGEHQAAPPGVLQE